MASEVNDKALKKTDVFSLIKEITAAEQDLNINVTNKSVKKLMDLYQKAIEYYSALDNKCFEDFLNRMTNLFKREDIQKALASPDVEEEEKIEEKENKNDELAGPHKNDDKETKQENQENSNFETDKSVTEPSNDNEDSPMLG